MPVIPCDNRAHHWKSPAQGACSFRPQGKVRFHGVEATRNPTTWSGGAKTLSARIFVGLNVGDAPGHNVDDVVRVVRAAREAQGHSPDSSFISQKGIYTSRKDGTIVEEDSVQVIIVDSEGVGKKQWLKEIVAIGEALCRELQQEEVVVQIQKGGVDVETFGVSD